MISLTAQSIPLLKGRVWVGVPYHPHSKPRVAGSIPAVSAMFASLIFRCKANVL